MPLLEQAQKSQGDWYLLEKKIELQITLYVQKLQKEIGQLNEKIVALQDELAQVKKKADESARQPSVQRFVAAPVYQEVPVQMMGAPQMQPQQLQQEFAAQAQMHAQQFMQSQQPIQPSVSAQPAQAPVQQGANPYSNQQVQMAQAQQQAPSVDLGKMFYMGGKR